MCCHVSIHEMKTLGRMRYLQFSNLQIIDKRLGLRGLVTLVKLVKGGGRGHKEGESFITHDIQFSLRLYSFMCRVFLRSQLADHAHLLTRITTDPGGFAHGSRFSVTVRCSRWPLAVWTQCRLYLKSDGAHSDSLTRATLVSLHSWRVGSVSHSERLSLVIIIISSIIIIIATTHIPTTMNRIGTPCPPK
ncbi:hypothetical protein B0H34DRAFT_515422 [Crassisporium funariophilum]|nr:hypothetical protein B0H34DRAFT_515422 [Crassisporium funariophilum]